MLADNTGTADKSINQGIRPVTATNRNNTVSIITCLFLPIK
jgi:hypothetical protein